MNVKHAVAPSCIRVGIIIDGTRRPIGISSKGVFGNAPQPANLSLHLIWRNYSFNQDFKLLWIAHIFLRRFVERADHPRLACELVGVYTLADFAQVAPQFHFLFAPDEISSYRD